ncbi:MAG TPA: DoxX family protein [Gemmatimonadaceae bacterium]|nr:DoxX family protein [Gemmatimonadaceae bacterium]
MTATNVPLQLTAISIGLLLLRLVVGFAMAAHGAQKLFGWFGGYGLAGTGGFFESLGFKPGRLFALAAGATEALSGLLVAFGFLGPVGPALMISVMIVAAVTVHWKNGYFATSNGIELPVMFAVAAVALAFTGYGIYSIDALTGLDAMVTPLATVITLLVGVVGAVGNLSLRRTEAPAPSTATR